MSGVPGGGSSSAAPMRLDGDSFCGSGPASRGPPSPSTAAQRRRSGSSAAAASDNRGRLRWRRRGRLWRKRTPPGCNCGGGCQSSAPALPIPVPVCSSPFLWCGTRKKRYPVADRRCHDIISLGSWSCVSFFLSTYSQREPYGFLESRLPAWPQAHSNKILIPPFRIIIHLTLKNLCKHS
jgi:hypothetical protein